MAESKRLFGPTVEELNAQLRDDQAAFMERANQLGPSYAAGAGVGSLLGGVVSSVFGIENPALKKARTLEEIQKRIRADNPGLTDKGAYYDIAASYLADAGYENEAMQAQEMATEFRTSQEDRDVSTRYKEAQIGELDSQAKARLLPKPYEAASPIGKLRADLAYAKSIDDNDTVKAIEAEIKTETEGKKLKPQEKVDQVIFDALVKEYGGDEAKAARAFNNISVNEKIRIAKAGAGDSLSKALEVITAQSKVQDKQASIKAVDTKLYTENLAVQLNETYPDLSEAEQSTMISDYKTAIKHALRSNMSEDEAEAYANDRISRGMGEVPGKVYGSNPVYKRAPLGKITRTDSPAPAKSDTGLPPGSKVGKKVTSGPDAGKFEVFDSKGVLIGYTD